MSTDDERPVHGSEESGPADAGPAESSLASPGAAGTDASPADAEESSGRLIRRGGRPDSEPATASAPRPGGSGAPSAATPQAMIPARGSRPPFEAVLMRLVATAGIIGISVAIAAIMGSQDSKAWLIGLVSSLVSVILAAVLWSSRRV